MHRLPIARSRWGEPPNVRHPWAKFHSSKASTSRDVEGTWSSCRPCAEASKAQQPFPAWLRAVAGDEVMGFGWCLGTGVLGFGSKYRLLPDAKQGGSQLRCCFWSFLFWEIINFCTVVSYPHTYLVLRNMTALPHSCGEVPEAVTMFNLAIKLDWFQQLHLWSLETWPLEMISSLTDPVCITVVSAARSFSNAARRHVKNLLTLVASLGGMSE